MKTRLDIVRGGRVSAEGLVVYAFDGAAPQGVPPAVAARVAAELKRRAFGAKRGEVSVVAGLEGKPVVVAVAGLGAVGDVNTAALHQATAAAVRALAAERVSGIEIALPAHAALAADGAADRALRIAEGALAATYRFERYVTGEAGRTPPPARIALALGAAQAPRAKAVVARAEIVADALALARDLVNQPPSDLYPEALAREARRAARGTGIRVTVLGTRELERERMGALLGVGRGSDHGPRLVHLVHRPKGKPRARIAFVGKGVTFDSGGYDIKPTEGMETMKCDMAGSAAVLAAVVALARLGAPVEVHAVMGLAENLVSGRAYKPGDVLRTRKGRTVEVNNTDAEGRLVLADALDWTLTKIKPQAVIDVATLTGACMVALGPTCSGLFASHDELAERLLAAGRAAGEQFWRLPLLPELRDQLKSDVADTKNTGLRWGGAITAGLFLQSFVDPAVPWAHLDIAGPAFLAVEHPYWGKGGTGAGTATLIEYALSL